MESSDLVSCTQGKCSARAHAACIAQWRARSSTDAKCVCGTLLPEPKRDASLKERLNNAVALFKAEKETAARQVALDWPGICAKMEAAMAAKTASTGECKGYIHYYHYCPSNASGPYKILVAERILKHLRAEGLRVDEYDSGFCEYQLSSSSAANKTTQ